MSFAPETPDHTSCNFYQVIHLPLEIMILKFCVHTITSDNKVVSYEG